jgi:hypothetical protein
MRGRPGWRAALVVGAALCAAAPALQAGFLDWFMHHDVQVITSTDTTPTGALLRAPSPSDPVYYLAMSVGYRDFGKAIAGDKLPVPQEMIRTVVRVLAKEGFLPADANHPPTQFIIFAWGTLYTDFMPDPWNPDMPGTQLNRWGVLRFLGGDKLGLVPDYPDPWMDEQMPGLTRVNPRAEAIWSVAADNLYVVALAGYEFPMQQPKHRKLLWRTKISCPSRGLAMADTLPTMLAIAAPYIARDTREPVWVNASDKFKPEVRIGSPKVEEYLDWVPAPVLEGETAPPKGSRSGK